VGGLSAGWLSDVVFKGNRVPVNVLFMIGNTLCLAALSYFSDGRADYVRDTNIHRSLLIININWNSLVH